MFVVALVHVHYGFRFRIIRRGFDRGEYEDTGTVKTERKVIDLLYFHFIIIYLFEDALITQHII